MQENKKELKYALKARKFSFLFAGMAVMIMLFSVLGAQGQNGTLSPLTRYGIGEIDFPIQARNVGMGGTILSQNNDGVEPNRALNLANPAALSSIGYMHSAIDLGANLKWYNIATTQASNTRFQGNMDYFAIGFNLISKKRENSTPSNVMGMAFGYKALSRVGYAITSGDTLSKDTAIYKGTGGGNSAFLAFGLRPWKCISIGLSGSYIWGDLDRSQSFFPNIDSSLLKISNQTTDNFTGFQFKAGILGEIPVGKNTSIKLGGIFEFASKLNNAHTDYLYNYRLTSDGLQVIRDTILYERNNKSNIKLPMAYGGGISLVNKGKYQIAFDWYNQNWSAVSSSYQGNLRDYTRYSFGVEYTPNILTTEQLNKLKRFFQRTSYRIGGYYLQNSTLVNGITLQQYGITAGLGIKLPPPTRFSPPSIVNIGLELAERGSLTETGVRERLARIYIGVTINDLWFKKRKYD
jgi:hypothetical protein